VNYTALSGSRSKFGSDGIEHGLVAIADPQADLFDATLFEIFQQVFPCLLIFPISHPKCQNLSLSSFRNSYHSQNRHFTAFAVVDHGEVGSRSLRIGIPLRQLALLPLGIFALETMKDT